MCVPTLGQDTALLTAARLILLSLAKKSLSISATSIHQSFAPRVPTGAAGTSWRMARYRRLESRNNTHEGPGQVRCVAGMRRQSKDALRANLVAILWTNETVWTTETEKTQNRQRCNQKIRVHHFLLRGWPTSRPAKRPLEFLRSERSGAIRKPFLRTRLAWHQKSKSDERP